MHYRKTACSFILVIATLLLSSSLALAKPVLIKLTLKESSDWSSAKSLGVVAYHKLENSILAEFDREKLTELDQVSLSYQIVDENPWSEEYFLVSPMEKVAPLDLNLYGKILCEDPKWQLIKTSREKASELRRTGYNAIPIRHSLPLEYKPAPFKLSMIYHHSPSIDSLISLISQDSLYAWDFRLQNFMTRYSYSDSIIKVRDWLYQKFASFGIDSLWLHHHYYDSDQWNVVATVEGTARPDKVIVVGGHYDSVVYGSGTDPQKWAPGADDNASGTVATLEMARIIAQNPLPVTTMFVLFAQEEQGLIGSDHFAEYLHNQGIDVFLMINCDMIGHSVDQDPDVVIYGDSSAASYIDIMMMMAQTYTHLHPVYPGQLRSSDHYSFYQWGYDAIFAHEGDFFYEGWHKNYDVVDSLNFPYMKEVTKMCLTTLALVGNSPSPVENMKAVDAGDGHTLYLSWPPNHPAENVVYYKVYFGTESGVYDSLHQVSVTADTLHGLVENTCYYVTVTAVNSGGFESIESREVSAIPRTVPKAPLGVVANPFGKSKIKLTWHPNQEADLDHYNIYRSEDSSTVFQFLSSSGKDTFFVDSKVSGEVETYYYGLTAVDAFGNESERSNTASAFAVSMDLGIWVVDETYANDDYNLVVGDSINAFYDRALKDYAYAYVDHSCPDCYPPNQLHPKELRRASVVIVHSEDNRDDRSLGAPGDSTYSVLKGYLDCGGKVIIEGRRNLSRGYDQPEDKREFFPGEMPYDYLKIRRSFVPTWSPSVRSEEFIGANSQLYGYPNLKVDSLRVAQSSSGLELLGRVPGIGYIDSLIAGEVIYTFNSAYDTSHFEGKPVGIRYLGDDHKIIFFDFPIYFIQEPQATQVLHRALSELGIFPGGEEAISSFDLKQNYPNPFNAETVIEYDLPSESRVKITIFNLLGQRVKILRNQRESAGHKRVVWDGRNDNGEQVASGIYFYQLSAENNRITKKMLLLK